MVETNRWRRVALVAGLLVMLAMYPAVAEIAPTGPAVETATCGRGDQPETGQQGAVPIADQDSGRSLAGYSCNMTLVGTNDLSSAGPICSLAAPAGCPLAGSTGDYAIARAWQMTWYGDCAYVVTNKDQTEGAITVIDASDSAHPTVVDVLTNAAGTTHEGIHANAARGILVVPDGTALPRTPPRTARIAVYDLEPDCRHPRLLAVVDTGAAPTGFHAGALSPDGRTFYGTELPVGPCLTAVDLADLAHPATLALYGLDHDCHDVDISRDGRRAYVGSYGGYWNAGAAPGAAFDQSLHPTAPDGLEILDTSQIQDRSPNAAITRLSSLNTFRPHTQALAYIAGRPYVFESQEGSCAPTTAQIVDVGDERHPTIASTLALEYQADPNCADNVGTVNADSFGTHYFGFDSNDDSAGNHEPHQVTTAFLTAYTSGLRAFDVRDPYHPREIGYFNAAVPPDAPALSDQAFSWIRYRPASGELWYSGFFSGFNVIRFTHGTGPTPTDPRYRARWRADPPPHLHATGFDADTNAPISADRSGIALRSFGCTVSSSPVTH